MTTRLTILTFVRYYLPGYKAGGAVQSIANLVEHLGNEFDFRIVTTDRDSRDLAPYPNVSYGQWHPIGKARVLYLEPEFRSIGEIVHAMQKTPHDLMYLNSFFDPRFTTLPLMARRLRLAPQSPVLIAPRGEFSLGALETRQRKKRAFLAAARRLQLHSGLTWQASSDYEAQDICRVMGSLAGKIRIAPDLPRSREYRAYTRLPRRPHTPLRIVFLSRISPMKNLLFALDVLSKVTVRVELTIIGPVSEPAYWAKCQVAINALPDHVQVNVPGPVPSEKVIETLADHDLFFLPTRGENYGHVIAEAVQAGLPILISDRTPWKGLAKEGIGRDLPLTEPSAFARYIEEIANQSANEKARLVENLRAYANKIFRNEELFSKMRECFYTSKNLS